MHCVGPAQNKTRQPSVIVQKDWKNEIDLDFQNLRKLKWHVETGEDM